MNAPALAGQPLSQVVLASGNAGKIREFRALLEPLGVAVVPQASLDAEYPLSLSVTIAGSMAAAAVACPSHAMTRTPVEGGFRCIARGTPCVIQQKPPQSPPGILKRSTTIDA